MVSFVVAAAVAATVSGANPGPAAPTAPVGIWQTQEKDALVRIVPCGGATICGVITWVDPASPGGGYDRMNSDRALRGRRIVGATILQGLSWDGRRWSGGSIYNPKDGRSYRANIAVTDKDRIEVSGCLGPICRTNTWLRREGI